jgi:FkbM family methyltransferase
MNLLFNTIPQIVTALSGGSFPTRCLLLLQLWFFAVTRKAKISKNDFAVRGICNTHPVTFYLRYVMDIAVLREVFVDKEYNWFPVADPKVIVDLGAHFGDTTLYYYAHFPDATIIAVEPSPENYERLVQHTKHIPNIIPVQAAVGGTDGTISLNMMSSSLGHSVKARKESQDSIEVKLITLKNLLEFQRIEQVDIIKFDIEGAEFDLFRDYNPAELAQSYIGELHFDLSDVTQEEFAARFTDFETKWIKIKTDRYLFHASKND